MATIQTRYSKTKAYDQPLYKAPASTQEIFSVKSIDEDGIFELADGKFSKCFVLSDINFAGVTDEEQKELILQFSRVINSLSYRFSYTVANEYLDENTFQNNILYEMQGDELDGMRREYNKVIRDKLVDAKQGLYQTIYFTVTINCEDIKEARSRFTSLESALRTEFISIGLDGMAGSQVEPLTINRRMQIWYNFTHEGMRNPYVFDFEEELRKGNHWKDIIAPSYMKFSNEYFEMNGRFGRVMYVKEYPNFLESDIIARLSDMNCTSYVTVNSELLDVTALKQEINRKYAAIGMKIENEKERNRKNRDFLADASSKLLAEKEELDEFVKKIDDGDDHYFNTTIMIMFLADSLEEMEHITERIASAAANKSVEFETCFNMQREGLNSTFMFGIQEFKRCCNLSSKCLAMFMPFKTQEINDENGSYYGINQLSQNAIFANRKALQNYNGLILGKPGSGKSVFAKSEIISTKLTNAKDQIIIIDPQNEYRGIAKAVGGEVVTFDSQKEIYVNPLDVDFEGVGYAELREIIGKKSDFIFTLLSSCMKRNLEADEQGVLDQVIDKVYSDNYAMRRRLNGEGAETTEFSVPEYMKTSHIEVPTISNLTNAEQVRIYSPTLQDVYQGLIDKRTPVSDKLAAYLQVFVNGSLNLFNHKTNVDINNSFLVFDLSNIKENLRTTSMLVMLEVIWEKAKVNMEKDKWTHLYIDEFHELLGVDAVAQFVIKLWKEIRKMHGVLTGITQNMTDLLNKSANSNNLAAIVSNTEYFALLNQSTIDRNMLADFLPNISPAMFNFVEGAASGTGLLKMGSVTVPFDMRMGRDNEIYRLVNTDGGATSAMRKKVAI